jgi:3-hydroxyisobutyrate dehydrogenase
MSVVMTDQQPSLGFIGLGLMGTAIAARLLGAGYPLTVWNRSPEKLAPAVAAGATAAPNPAAVARAADIVFVCVTDDAAVEHVMFGAGGVAEGGVPDKLIVDCSTIRPAASRELAKRLELAAGTRWIDAPVTGGKTGAEAGRLVIVAGGDEADIERVRPIMAAISQSFVRMGPQGAGLVTKLCNQVVNACNKVVLSEMLLLARGGGIDGARLPAVLKGGSADSMQLQREVPRMVERDFEKPHGTARTILKDLDIIREFAQLSDTPMPVTALVNELYRLHVARGNGERDSISIFDLLDAQR